MKTLLRKDLTYAADSMAVYSFLREAGDGFLLDSGEGYADHIDVYSAAPAYSETIDHARSVSIDRCVENMDRMLRRHSVNTSSAHPLPGWYGVWSYELGELTENVSLTRHAGGLPLLWMGFYPSVIVTDHKNNETVLYGLPGFETHFNRICDRLSKMTSSKATALEISAPVKLKFEPQASREQYNDKFERVINYIQSGDCYQVNLAHSFKATHVCCAWTVYQALRQDICAPMGSFFESSDWALLSLSPERFLRCHQGALETKPIKGTRPRSDELERDRDQVNSLLNSDKDQAENLMIVDLLRNDLGRSCTPGSVTVPKLFEIESFSNVHHLVSTVTGQLMDSVTPLLALMRAFPGGSITGAPKHRAMEIIDELEQSGRGFYCGSVIYCDVSGKMDSSILIRSLVSRSLESGQQEFECWAGGGIVADSTADDEYQETLDKVGNIINTLS